MSDRLLYLLIDASVLLLPLVFSFHPRIRFHRHWPAFFKACAIVLVLFISWDIAFTRMGIWGFNPRYVTGSAPIGLPLEEWLFFICIPYACVFTFYCIQLLEWKLNHQAWCIGLALSGLTLFLFGLMNLSRAYTSTTFLLNGLLLVYLGFLRRPEWLPIAVVSYILILPFFFVSNGVLTGSWIPEEVVWYNDQENLSVRIGTIPIEDVFYGFALVIMNISLFEHFRRKRIQVEISRAPA